MRSVQRSAESSINCIERLFYVSAYSSTIAKWKEKTTAQVCLIWSILAFYNDETELGQKLFRKSILLNRSILDIGARKYFNFLVKYAINEGYTIDRFVKLNIDQLSPEFAWMSQYLNESIARGYFYKAVCDIAFGEFDNAFECIVQANNYGVTLSRTD